MKKFIIVSAFVLGAFTASAQNDQTALQGTKFGDNWSIGINAGATTPLTHSAFFKNARPAFGFGVAKQLTPVFGFGLQGMGYVNTTQSKTAFDASDVSLLGKVNLMNLFAGYQGTPRLFEIEAVAGIGWLHYYMNGPGDENSWSTRLGLNLNFNLGESKTWTLGVKPAIVYDMQGDFNTAKSRFNANNAAFELTAGLAYHFKTSNGTHHFTTVKPYNAAEIAELNSSINNLRSQVGSKDSQLATTTRQVNELQSELDACRNKVVPVETVIKNLDYIRKNLSPETKLVLILGSEVPTTKVQAGYENMAERHKIMNQSVRKWCAANNAQAIELTDFIKSDEDYTTCINHFSREVYANLAGEVQNIINKTFCDNIKL